MRPVEIAEERTVGLGNRVDMDESSRERLRDQVLERAVLAGQGLLDERANIGRVDGDEALVIAVNPRTAPCLPEIRRSRVRKSSVISGMSTAKTSSMAAELAASAASSPASGPRPGTASWMIFQGPLSRASCGGTEINNSRGFRASSLSACRRHKGTSP